MVLECRRRWGRAMLVAGGLAGGALLSAGPAGADVKAGVDAWSTGDYSAAIREWKDPAAKGDPDALFNLAQAYKTGRGVKQDLAKAEELYGQAAARGHLQASDNYGLLLFQRGERAKAMPYINAAAERGESRAQYVLGLAYFNGENVPKDWVRAYALTSLAHQAQLPQATAAMAQMDKYISLEDRQKGVAMAAELSDRAQATRARQVAAADLGSGPSSGSGPAGNQIKTSPSAVLPSSGRIRPFVPPAPAVGAAERAADDAARVAQATGPASSGADYARPRSGVPQLSSVIAAPPAVPTKPAKVPKPKPEPKPAATPVAKPAPKPAAAPVPASPNGQWRVQLGAFGVRSNAEGLWNRVKARPELAGHDRIMLPAGRLTRLLAGGFATQADASAACARLKAGGFACLPTRD